MARDEHHVVPNSQKGGWDIKRNNATRSSGHSNTKEEATKAGRTISKNQNTELIIHQKNGKVQNSDSHGHDPCPPRDKR